MRVWKIMAAAAFVLMTVGCIAGPVETVKIRASHDLDCPKEQLNTKEIGRYQFAVKGCGKEQDYTCFPQTRQCIPERR